MLKIGKICHLSIVKTTAEHVVLDAENLGKAYLPLNMAPDVISVGEPVEVFTYPGPDGQLIATTDKPKCQIGEFAYLKVVHTTDVGAFVDNGLDKDVLVPFAEQHRPMQMAQSYIVYLYLDKRDGRMTASSKIDKFLDDEKPHQFEARQSVNLLIANSTDLGFKAIVDNSHWGVLYKDEVFQRLSFGQSLKGFIKQVRADGKIDLSLQSGQESRDKHAIKILRYLERNDGYAAVHDKSDPKLISDMLGMSKGAFKKAVGALYKQRIISIEKDGIRQLKK